MSSTTNLLLLIMIGVSVVALMCLALATWWYHKLGRKDTSKKETQTDIERRLMESTHSPTRTQRLKLENKLMERLTAVGKDNEETKKMHKQVMEDYDNRFYHHVNVLKEDPDTMDLPKKQRELRRNIKHLRQQVDDREQSWKESKVRDAEEAEEERAHLARKKIDDKYFGNGKGGKSGEGGRDDDLPYLTKQIEAAVQLPSRTLRIREEMTTLRKELAVQQGAQQFRKMDVDNSGFIDKEELRLRMQASEGKPISDAEVDFVFSSIDIDGNGLIDISEYLEYCQGNMDEEKPDWVNVEIDAQPDDIYIEDAHTEISPSHSHNKDNYSSRAPRRRGFDLSHKGIMSNGKYTLQTRTHVEPAPHRSEIVHNYIYNKTPEV